MRRITKITAGILFLTSLFSVYGAGRKETPGSYDDRVTTEQLGGVDRYLTYLSTDKPIYRTGDTFFLRGVLLHARTNAPYTVQGNAYVQITGPKGDIVVDAYSDIIDSTLAYQWQIPAGLPGGEYKATVNYPDWGMGFAPAERKFEIRAYRPPRLKTEITFFKDSYFPGETVKAVCSIKRAQGDIPAGAAVTVIARLDDAEIFNSREKVDARGDCEVSFPLPLKILRGEGNLAFIIEDGGITETASRTLPVVLENFQVNFYPEGGDLVAGLENRVYVEAKDNKEQPVAMEGTVMLQGGSQVATFKTMHEGRGSFVFRPAAGKKYYLKATSGSGTEKQYPLPQVKDKGIVLHSGKDLYRKKEPVTFTVAAGYDTTVLVYLSRREEHLLEETVKLKAGVVQQVSFSPPVSAAGILMITVLENDKPVAERLIYREPADNVKVSFQFNKEQYAPGDTVELTVKTTTADNRPTEAFVGLRVTEDPVLQLISTREQAPDLPAMVFLENEVLDLKDAHVYLDAGNSSAAQQLDLLLGTQGWRRFAFYTWNQFMQQYGDKAKRIAALKFIPQPVREDRGIFLDQMFMKEERIPKAAEGRMRNEIMPAAVPEPEMPAEDLIPAGEILDADLANDEEWADEAAREKRDIMILAREYAHKKAENWSPEKREDFTETVFWAACLKTDAAAGKATVKFDLNDNITSYRATADCFNNDGSLGSGDALISSVKPFYIEPKLPTDVSLGDKLIIPVAFFNNTNQVAAGTAEVHIENRKVTTLQLSLKPGSSVRKNVSLELKQQVGAITITIKGVFGEYKDEVTRTFQIHPTGFPVEENAGGLLSAAKPLQFEITIPGQIVEHSLESDIMVYPSPVANLTQAIEALIRQPYGCFEQTSSTSYPLVMAQQYFMTHSGVDPDLVHRAKANLDDAYKRLTGFECRDKGYEWFGESPGHEALTAYGLMEFLEMKKVMTIDEGMINRTRDWLLARRNGKGGYNRNQRALDSFGGAPEDTTNAYITWALLSAGVKDLQKEVEALKTLAAHTADSYIIALAANGLYMTGDKATAVQLMKHLAGKQDKNGAVQGAVTTITRSGGEALIVETTALAVLAWLEEEAFAANVELGIKYLAGQCQQGMFYSTQGTILALKAIILYDKYRSRPKAPGKVQVLIDGVPYGGTVPFTADTKGIIGLPDIAPALKAGRHQITVKMEAGSEMPCSATVKYNTFLPPSSAQCKLDLEVKLAHNTIREGEVTEMRVKVQNRTGTVLPTCVALVGLPGGLVPNHDQLKELVKAGTIAFYEITGQDIIFYWRSMQPDQKIEFPVNCIADIPGEYTAPAGRIYEYYTSEYKTWVPGNVINITPRS